MNHGALAPQTPDHAGRNKIADEEETDLNELRAPAPVHEDVSGEWQKQQHLESPEPEKSPPTVSTVQVSERLTLLYTISHLIFFSIFGVLARLGIQWLTFYPGAPVPFSNLWANVGGTFVMGFLSQDKKLFQQQRRKRHQSNGDDRDGHVKPPSVNDASKEDKNFKKTIPLFIGLSTGFCGSFTSFSTFIRDAFFALANHLPTPVSHPTSAGRGSPSSDSYLHRNAGYSVMAVLAVILITLGMSIGALVTGAHVAEAMHPLTPTIPTRTFRRYIDPCMVFLAFGCWAGTLFLAIWPPDRPGGPSSRGSWMNETWRGEVLFAILFGPPGCLIRWYASVKLNGKLSWLPLGTFLVNMAGVAIEAMCYDLQHVPLASAAMQIGGGRVACQVLQGIMDGFCGSLTTVSTWAVELYSLKRHHSYLYGSVSIAAGLMLMIVIMGSVLWSIGWQAPSCTT